MSSRAVFGEYVSDIYCHLVFETFLTFVGVFCPWDPKKKKSVSHTNTHHGLLAMDGVLKPNSVLLQVLWWITAQVSINKRSSFSFLYITFSSRQCSIFSIISPVINKVNFNVTGQKMTGITWETHLGLPARCTMFKIAAFTLSNKFARNYKT